MLQCLDHDGHYEGTEQVGLVITFALGIFVLAGAAIAGFSKKGDRIREISIAVALGALVALVIGDLIPESIEEIDELGIPLMLLGIALGFIVLIALDRLLPEHHESHDHQHDADHEHVHVRSHALHISIVTTIALVVHNIIEGMSVCGVAMESVTTALLLGFGVGVHNIPMGMIVYSGIRDESTGHKIIIMSLAALSTFAGGIIMFALSYAVDERIVLFMINMTIGMVLYIVLMELLPHTLHSSNKRLAVICALAGFAVVIASGAIESIAG